MFMAQLGVGGLPAKLECDRVRWHREHSDTSSLDMDARPSHV